MRANAPDRITNAAVRASTRMDLGVATVGDVDAYRAWITWMRLHGDDEEDLRGAITKVDAYATKLGMP